MTASTAQLSAVYLEPEIGTVKRSELFEERLAGHDLLRIIVCRP